MTIKKIEAEECETARFLWEEVFYEDSKVFTDYYFQYKAKLNTGYVMGEYPYRSMLFRTPYLLQIGEIRKEISYLVGVATKKEFRHQGYMRRLLLHAFEEMYQEKMPFTFLMPANPAIYEPFDFRYIYERPQWDLRENKGENFAELVAAELEKNLGNELMAAEWEKNLGNELMAAVQKKNSGDELTAAEIKRTIPDIHHKELNGIFAVTQIKKQFPDMPIMDMLAEFANIILKQRYQVYAHRTAAYYEMQLKESLAQNGDIFICFEAGKIKSFYLYAKEEENVFLQEVLEEQEGSLEFIEKKETKKPIIMARIIHLEEMMKLVKSNEEKEITIFIEDNLILENTGVYRWKITPEGSRVERLKDGTMSEYQVHIRDLAPMILKDVFINELV